MFIHVLVSGFGSSCEAKERCESAVVWLDMTVVSFIHMTNNIIFIEPNWEYRILRRTKNHKLHDELSRWYNKLLSPTTSGTGMLLRLEHPFHLI